MPMWAGSSNRGSGPKTWGGWRFSRAEVKRQHELLDQAKTIAVEEGFVVSDDGVVYPETPVTEFSHSLGRNRARRAFIMVLHNQEGSLGLRFPGVLSLAYKKWKLVRLFVDNRRVFTHQHPPSPGDGLYGRTHCDELFRFYRLGGPNPDDSKYSSHPRKAP
jgi:hypothetical protein